MTNWREELAWAAGFYDGEGCTSICITRGKPRGRVNVNQNETITLERFQRAVLGLGRINGPYGDHHMYGWGAGKWEEMQATIAMLWAFLSETKRKQAARVLAQATWSRPADSVCPKGHLKRLDMLSDGKCGICVRARDNERYHDGRHDTNKNRRQP